MTNLEKDATSAAVGFVMMIATATASYAVPIPMLRDLLTQHLAAIVVWTVCTSIGWGGTFYVRKRLDRNK